MRTFDALVFDLNQAYIAIKALLFQMRFDCIAQNVNIEAFYSDEFALIFDSRALRVINGGR